MMMFLVLFTLCSSISDASHLKLFQPDIIQRTENLIRNNADCGDDCVEVQYYYATDVMIVVAGLYDIFLYLFQLYHQMLEWVKDNAKSIPSVPNHHPDVNSTRSQRYNIILPLLRVHPTKNYQVHSACYLRSRRAGYDFYSTLWQVCRHTGCMGI